MAFPYDVTVSISYRLNNNNGLTIPLKPSMLQSQQSLIRQTMFTLILATNRIYQVMSYKSIQDYRLELILS